MPIITLTTDFGITDSYVGQVKGVILGIAPDAKIVDISHNIPAQNIAVGGLVLDSAIDAFPAGTIHVAVVDPGVGSDRAPVAVQTDRCVLVGPDNGVLAGVLGRYPLKEAVCLTHSDFHRHPVSNTFHGRDIFAPVAAHLANGTPLRDLGQPIANLTCGEIPRPVIEGDRLTLHVVHTDRFGNLLTDLTHGFYMRWRANRDRPDTPVTIDVGKHHINGISHTFNDADPGHLVAYFGSTSHLEIAVRNGNASEWLRADSGARLVIHLA